MALLRSLCTCRTNVFKTVETVRFSSQWRQHGSHRRSRPSLAHPLGVVAAAGLLTGLRQDGNQSQSSNMVRLDGSSLTTQPNELPTGLSQKGHTSNIPQELKIPSSGVISPDVIGGSSHHSHSSDEPQKSLGFQQVFPGGPSPSNLSEDDDDDDGLTAGQWIKDLPVFTFKEVSAHDSIDTGVWVIYKNGVYDITKFVSKHPGGEILLVGAGKSIEPFWKLYSVHNSNETYLLLETMRIGNYDNSSTPVDDTHEEEEEEDQWINEPKTRHPALIHNQDKPFNAEPPAAVLTGAFHTPNDVFYIRNHLPVPPVVKSEDYRLEITRESGIDGETVQLSLDEVQEFPHVSLSAALQCGGNRRSGMSLYKQVRGLSWKSAAIGNASWTGVRLRDVLKHAGVSEDDFGNIKHVQFEGLDEDIMGSSYGASIPIEIAMDPQRDVLLVFKMNGKDLPIDHGYPLRVLVPGTVGARSVKWVSRIVLSTEESPSIWQRRDYKLFPPNIDITNVDYTSSPAMQDMPVQSAICLPMADSIVSAKDGTVTVRGYAWSGGGRGIVRVDVSVNGGRDWLPTQLQSDPNAKDNMMWAWSLWEVIVPIPSDHSGQLDICCKAVDSSCNTQPESVQSIWNFRGLANNSWHHIQVKVVNK